MWRLLLKALSSRRQRSTSGSSRPLEKITIQGLKFVGEQDGPVEQILKIRLSQLFERQNKIWRAYLARARVDNSEGAGVILGLRAKGDPDKTMLEQIGSAFASIFSVTVHLDIVFLTEEQEGELAQVCRCFWDSMISPQPAVPHVPPSTVAH